MTSKKTLIDKINQLKKEKNAIILTHFYQRPNLYKIADFIGDSLDLSRKAAATEAEIIVFCGVSFMAETAKILSPDKKVLLPDLNSGCLMADMIEAHDLVEIKRKHPDAAVMCYVNSTAAVKAESDICCTSANAVKVAQSLKEDKIIFVPDKGLGGYIARFVPDKEVILYDGLCPTHWYITVEDLKEVKKDNPNALIIVHPECDAPVIDLADYVGSTSGILNFAANSDAKDFIVGSEVGILLYMQEQMPEKNFILPTKKAVCQNMKRNTLEQVLDCLENETNSVTVDPEIAKKAYNAIKRMISIG